MNEAAVEERMTTEEREAGGFSTIMIYILWLAGLAVLGRKKKVYCHQLFETQSKYQLW